MTVLATTVPLVVLVAAIVILAVLRLFSPARWVDALLRIAIAGTFGLLAMVLFGGLLGR
jgi:hypothetical protein